MKIAIGIIAAVYILGFVGVMWAHTQLPATFGLALLRAALWPLAIVTGRWWPHGTPLPMD